MAPVCVEHLVDGRKSWQLGVLGFFSKYRGLLTSTATTLVTMGVPWWLPKPPAAIADAKVTFAMLTGLLGSAAVAGFYYLRRRSIRSLEVKAVLHWMTHALRDQIAGHALARAAGADKSAISERIRRDLAETCQRVANYFRLLTGDDSIGASIRLATLDASGTKQVYRTVARSSNFNINRSKTSEDLNEGEGLMRFLADKGKKGVLFYHDLDAAAKLNLIVLGRNQELFPHEIRSMMVAPVNGWNNEEDRLLGVIYVTSNRPAAFYPALTDALLFVADAVAASLSATYLIHAPVPTPKQKDSP